MTYKHGEKPKIVLSKQVDKQITWMTQNVNTEVAALGRCEFINGGLFVKELVFPNQKVTCGSVKFGNTDWKCIIKEVGSKNMNEVLLHWHTHPGSATPSTVDEDDTFGSFMDGNRPFFAFLITGIIGNRMDYDARFLLNKPVVANIEVDVESEEDTEVEELCKKILKEKIKPDEIETKIPEPTFPSLSEYKGTFFLSFGTMFKNAVQEELTKIDSIILSHIYSKKNGVGLYTIKPTGKAKHLRRELNKLVDDYDVDFVTSETAPIKNVLNYYGD